MDYEKKTDAFDIWQSNIWSDYVLRKINYFRNLSNQIHISYIIITEYIGDPYCPFPPDKDFIDEIVIGSEKIKKELPNKEQESNATDFLTRELEEFKEFLSKPISTNEDYLLGLSKCSKYLYDFLMTTKIMIEFTSKFKGIHEIRKECFEECKRAGYEDLNQKSINDARRLAKANIHLVPIQMLQKVAGFDYLIIERFYEVKGLWTNKVAASRRGRKVASVRTEKRKENIRIVKEILTKHGFKADNKVVGEAMKETDRCSKTVKSMISEVLRGKKQRNF